MAVPGTTAVCLWCREQPARRKYCSPSCVHAAYNATPKGKLRNRRYRHSEKGTATYHRYNATEKRRITRDRHEAVRGYTRKRVESLAKQRERTVAQLDELRRSVA